MVLFNHLYEGVIGKTVFTDRREVGGFPSRAIEILFDLWWHVEGDMLVCSVMRYLEDRFDI